MLNFLCLSHCDFCLLIGPELLYDVYVQQNIYKWVLVSVSFLLPKIFNQKALCCFLSLFPPSSFLFSFPLFLSALKTGGWTMWHFISLPPEMLPWCSAEEACFLCLRLAVTSTCCDGGRNFSAGLAGSFSSPSVLQEMDPPIHSAPGHSWWNSTQDTASLHEIHAVLEMLEKKAIS